jgi:hypothetical protein
MTGLDRTLGEASITLSTFFNVLVTSLITGVGMSYLLKNRINQQEISDEMLIEELKE